MDINSPMEVENFPLYEGPSPPDLFDFLHNFSQESDCEKVQTVATAALNSQELVPPVFPGRGSRLFGMDDDKMCVEMSTPAARENSVSDIKNVIFALTSMGAAYRYVLFKQALAKREGGLIDALIAIDAQPNVNEAFDTLLHCAARVGDVEATRALLDRTVSLEANTKHGYTALHCASQEGHAEVVSLLLAAGANINAKNFDGDFPYQLAHEQSEERIMQLLREGGFKPCETPLHKAVKEGDVARVAELVREGANVDAIEAGEHSTPLHYACLISDEEKACAIIQELLPGGAKINQPDQHGWTPLHEAANAGNFKVVRMLLNNGADPAIIHRLGQIARDGLGESVEEDWTDEQKMMFALLSPGGEGSSTAGITPLHYAVERGENLQVGILLEDGSDVNLQQVVTLKTPLHYAFCNEDEEKVQWMVEQLLARGADANKEDLRGITPLHLALKIVNQKIRREVIEMLLAHGADALKESCYGTTPFGSVMQKGNQWAVKRFRSSTGSIPLAQGNSADYLGRAILDLSPLGAECRYTFLRLAIEIQDDRMIDALVAIDLAFQSKAHCSTLLHHAADEGNDEVTMELLKKNVSTEERDMHGMTPLHSAVLAGHNDIIYALVSAGADLASTDNSGKTPYQLAEESGNKRIMHALEIIEGDEGIRRACSKDCQIGRIFMDALACYDSQNLDGERPSREKEQITLKRDREEQVADPSQPEEKRQRRN